MTFKSKYKKELSMHNLDRSFLHQGVYLLKNTKKNACMDSPFCSSQFINILELKKFHQKKRKN